MEVDLPSTELMTPIQGFWFVPSGLRTRSLGSGGSFGAEAALVRDWGVPLPATIFKCPDVVSGGVDNQGLTAQVQHIYLS